MKLSDKFKNLGPSGLARRVAPNGGDAPVVSQAPTAGAQKDRVKRWRKANPELYLERQRIYQARYKAKKLAERAKK